MGMWRLVGKLNYHVKDDADKTQDLNIFQLIPPVFQGKLQFTWCQRLCHAYYVMLLMITDRTYTHANHNHIEKHEIYLVPQNKVHIHWGCGLTGILWRKPRNDNHNQSLKPHTSLTLWFFHTRIIQEVHQYRGVWRGSITINNGFVTRFSSQGQWLF